MDVKLVIPHLPTVPADLAATGRLVFSFSLTNASNGNAYVCTRPLFQRDILPKKNNETKRWIRINPTERSTEIRSENLFVRYRTRCQHSTIHPLKCSHFNQTIYTIPPMGNNIQ